jgi:hypothetical protein
MAQWVGLDSESVEQILNKLSDNLYGSCCVAHACDYLVSFWRLNVRITCHIACLKQL